ncbi:MAG: hypothetical protein EZS28_049155 [Streblomastix strix]|uniref:Reverse transcriptase domain-containing protein n=1 Tax=Streblomastix strix TaxID=222440 RepID=A0A5J4TAN2_9EUKA|nr:MAG: hypothetical protein EZS28_049155 [Streblomastix strix]
MPMYLKPSMDSKHFQAQPLRTWDARSGESERAGLESIGEGSGASTYGIEAQRAIDADKWVMEGARVMWNDGDAKERLDYLCGRQKEQRGIIGEEKFWEELKVEIKQGIVRKRSIEEIIHFNPFYMVPKAGNKLRKILYFMKLNRAIAKQHFWIEDVITVTKTMKQGDYATQLDLEKAYHHLKVSKDFQTQIGFKFRGKAYCFVVLPFGWNRSTLLFCGVMQSTV